MTVFLHEVRFMTVELKLRKNFIFTISMLCVMRSRPNTCKKI